MNAHSPVRPTPLLRSYGRRKGKRLSARKERLVTELLPRLRPDLERPAPDDARTLFRIAVGEVWLEIGFGAGEHVLWQASRNNGVGVIGCEPFVNGVASLLGAIEERNIENVLIHDGDARDVLAWLPPASIARIFVLFPDPWPKKRQAKRRLVSPDFVDALARVLQNRGELRFASDDKTYAAQTLLAVNRNGAFAWIANAPRDWLIRPEDWPETRYERKALNGTPVYLRWQRVERTSQERVSEERVSEQRASKAAPKA